MDFFKENWISILIVGVVLVVLYKCYVENFSPKFSDPSPYSEFVPEYKCLKNCNVTWIKGRNCDPSKGELFITPENIALCNSG
jgi:hypothetical protein